MKVRAAHLQLTELHQLVIVMFWCGCSEDPNAGEQVRIIQQKKKGLFPEQRGKMQGSSTENDQDRPARSKQTRQYIEKELMRHSSKTSGEMKT